MGSKWVNLSENVFIVIWEKVFKNGFSIICGKQPLKTLRGMVLPYSFKFLEAVFHKLYIYIFP